MRCVKRIEKVIAVVVMATDREMGKQPTKRLVHSCRQWQGGACPLAPSVAVLTEIHTATLGRAQAHGNDFDFSNFCMFLAKLRRI